MSAAHPASANPYLFGDTDLAAGRLRLLAQAFEPSTRGLLQRLAAEPPSIARIADLGCGPGHTTRLLAEVFPRATVHGLDSSEHFVDVARQSPLERVEYVVADVTAALPEGPYDLIYARYLLTHISRPRETIVDWSAHLMGGGRIAIEENEWIHATQPVFARYLEIVQAMLLDAGQRLYVGADLARETSWPSLELALSEVAPLGLADSLVARMFLMNLATWRSQPFIERNVPSAEIESLRNNLEQLVQRDSPASSIEFGRRRLVLAKVETR